MNQLLLPARKKKGELDGALRPGHLREHPLAGVGVVLAAAHQGGAMVVFTVVLALNHALRREKVRRAAAGQLHAA